MKLEKYEDKSKKNRKAILISLGVIVLISVSLGLYKTFASFTESTEFQVMKGKVDYFGNSDVYFAFYKGDEELEEMPQKDNKEKLVFDYGTCDNGASIKWDNEAWGPMVKDLSTNKTKCSLYFGKIVELDKDIQTVESGDGLYKVEHNDLKELDSVWNKTEYRYAGVNPNNYVRFNNEIWRIIGLVNVKNSNGIEQRLKLIRKEGIEGQKIFGGYSWDYKLAGNGSSDSEYGSSEWNDSQLKDMLNGIYYNSEVGDCYKIVGKGSPEQCDFTGNGELPKGLDETARNMIDDEVIWNIGGWIRSDIIASQFYEKERGTTVWQGHKTEWSEETDVGGKHNGIGLMYPSDYGYAVGGDVRGTCLTTNLSVFENENCHLNDWLFINLFSASIHNYWFLFPSTRNSYETFDFNHSGFIGALSGPYNSNNVMPVVYLKNTVKILENPNQDLEYGSIDNPFVLK